MTGQPDPVTQRPGPAANRRSHAWTSGDDEVAMLHRVALRMAPEDRGKPVIGIADTSSDLNPCNESFSRLIPVLADAIRTAGGIPVRFPAMSLGEDLMKPSAMLYRNLLAMELEEDVRAYPLDGVVYLAGCDKTVPASLMAAASTAVPSLLLLAGARSAPVFRGKPLGAGTDLWRALEDRRAGLLDDEQWTGLEKCLSCAGPGTCNTMGTASSLALLTEMLGMTMPGSGCLDASAPELDAVARATGRRVVELVAAATTPGELMTQAAFDNAATVLAAIGGSTNAVVHLAAVAGRLGRDASLRRMDRLWREVPLVADIEPCGRGLISDLARDGGLPAVVRSLGSLIDRNAVAADGRTWGEIADGAPAASGVVATVDQPVMPAPTMVAVFGSLALRGAVIKTAAASRELWQHRGPALVFDSYAQMRERLDDPDLGATRDTVIVVRGCGPVGVPGMPEWGMAPIPRALVSSGVRDMVRISDGRMSGTSFGTVALHVAPESAVGGPLALVRNGDPIVLDIDQRRLDLEVPDQQVAERAAQWSPPPSAHVRGWPALYQREVLQADAGADLAFLTATGPEGDAFVEPIVGRS